MGVVAIVVSSSPASSLLCLKNLRRQCHEKKERTEPDLKMNKNYTLSLIPVVLLSRAYREIKIGERRYIASVTQSLVLKSIGFIDTRARDQRMFAFKGHSGTLS